MREANWIADFLRQTLLQGHAVATPRGWATALIDCLQQAKPDNEIHLFAVSRIPKMPNYLIGSTSETFPQDEPLRMRVTEKTAETFLGPVEYGVRMIRQELPLSVFIDLDSGEETRRHELTFYDAVCFDTKDTSIIMALVLSDGDLGDFVSAAEIGELLPIIRIQGIPLVESYIYRVSCVLKDQELDLVTGLAYRNTISAAPPAPLLAEKPVVMEERKKPKTAFQTYITPEFFDYATRELRTCLDELVATREIRSEMLDSHAGIGEQDEMTPLRAAINYQTHLIRNLTNLNALLQPQVKPQVEPVSMQKFMRSLGTIVRRIADRYEVTADVDTEVRNFYAAGDEETLLRICERLLEFHLSLCRGGACWVRLDDDPRRGEAGFVMIEIEDNARVIEDIQLEALMGNLRQYGSTHPRIRRGGAVLYQLLALFLEKSGGKFRLGRGKSDGFAAQILLPKVSRSEVDRSKATEAE
jgi:hypothetical protein